MFSVCPHLEGGGTHIPECFATFPRMPWGSRGGIPISPNALQHFPECHGAGGGVPCQVQPGGGTLPGPGGGYPGRGGTLAGGVPWLGVPWPGGTLAEGYPGWGGTLVKYPPSQVRMGGYPAQGGYPGRTTEGVLTTQRAVCLLRSRRRTFLFSIHPECGISF